MSAAALTGLIGQLAGQQQQLPLQYGGLYQNAYQPGFGYLQNQANNMTSLGQGGMNLYGNLAGQQASMYQSELPIRSDMAMFNALAPALSGLLSQGGLNLPALGQMNMQFDRPDVMGGYQGVMDSAYNQAKGYDSTFGAMQADMMDRMPVAPYLRPQAPAPQQPVYQSPLNQPPPPPVMQAPPHQQLAYMNRPMFSKSQPTAQPQRKASPAEMDQYNRSLAHSQRKASTQPFMR